MPFKTVTLYKKRTTILKKSKKCSIIDQKNWHLNTKIKAKQKKGVKNETLII